MLHVVSWAMHAPNARVGPRVVQRELQANQWERVCPKRKGQGPVTPQELAPSQPASPARLPACLPPTLPAPQADTLFLCIQRHRRHSVPAASFFSRFHASPWAVYLFKALEKQDDAALHLS